MSTPATKADFYARYHRGEFGNRPRLWRSWAELQASGYHGLVSVRSRFKGWTFRCRVHTDGLRLGKLDLSNATFNESMPDHLLTIQGNLWVGIRGLELEYSLEPGITHREAVSQPRMRSAAGLFAKGLLERFVDPASLEDLWGLLNDYPDAVIEFSAYRVPVGVLPHRRCVIWEVRQY